MKKKEKKKENVKGKNTTIKKRKKKEYIYILCDLLGSQRESVRSRETGQYIKSEKGSSLEFRREARILGRKKNQLVGGAIWRALSEKRKGSSGNLSFLTLSRFFLTIFFLFFYLFFFFFFLLFSFFFFFSSNHRTTLYGDSTMAAGEAYTI